jgi:hypothetical protein
MGQVKHRWELVCCTFLTTRFPRVSQKKVPLTALFYPEASVKKSQFK